MPAPTTNDDYLRRLIAALPARGEVERTAIEMQQIPAPTFEEQERSDEVRRRFAALGLNDVAQDQLANVYGCRRGATRGAGVLIAAHLDTVFPRTTDLAVIQEGNLIHGPGIGDNSLGVAGLLHLAATIECVAPPLRTDIWYVADVCEEGLGNLRGMRAVLERLAEQVGMVIALEGTGFGRIYHQAIGVTRLQIETRAPGGHSWADYGAPSAVHLLAQIAAALTQIEVPSEPRSSLNIGTIQGGTSINVIAEQASLLLDLRSMDQPALDRLTATVEATIAAVPWPPQTTVTVDTVGRREAGALALDHPLARAAAAALEAVDAEVVWGSGSTDANVPLARAVPAICTGLAQGGNTHRLDEYVDVTDLPRGMEALVRLVWSLAAPAP